MNAITADNIIKLIKNMPANRYCILTSLFLLRTGLINDIESPHHEISYNNFLYELFKNMDVFICQFL